MRVHVVGVVEIGVQTDVEQALVRAGHTISHQTQELPPDCLVLVVGDAVSTTDVDNLQEAVSRPFISTPIIGLRVGPETPLPTELAAALSAVTWVPLGHYPGLFEHLIAAVTVVARTEAPARSTRRLVTTPPSGGIDGQQPEHTTAGKDDPRRRILPRRRSKDEPTEPTVTGQTIFVSYSRRDKLAGDVVTELRRHGHEVWVDTSSILGGADWRKSIQNAIEQSQLFILLLSPNVAKSPKYVWTEVGYAETLGKTIIPVRLKKTSMLPDGFGFVLSSHNYVDLFPDFQTGMGMLLAALGAAAGPADIAGVGARIKRAQERTSIWMHQHEVGSKVKRYGGTAAAVAAVVGLAMAKEIAKEQGLSQARLQDLQQKHLTAMTHNKERAKQETQSREEAGKTTYADNAARLLRDAADELIFTEDMSTSDFRVEFRPRFLYVLGQLEAIRPEWSDVAVHHDKLVKGLKDLLESLDLAARTADNGDEAAYHRALKRYSSRLAELLTTQQSWLRSL